MCALGIALQIFESMLPGTAVLPGVKLGLANIVTLIALYVCGAGSAFLVAVLRSALASLLYGGVSSMLYSVSGAVCAAAIMIWLFRSRRARFSCIGVSMAGALVHNTVQVCVSAVLLSNVWMFSYLPILSLTGCITGLLTGYGARECIKYFDKKKETL